MLIADLHLQGKRLVINVDVSNSCFWHPVDFYKLALELSGERLPEKFQASCKRRPDGREPMILPMLKRLCRNKFIVKHRGSDGKFYHALSLSTQHY